MGFSRTGLLAALLLASAAPAQEPKSTKTGPGQAEPEAVKHPDSGTSSTSKKKQQKQKASPAPTDGASTGSKP
jgi:hypothetical protein